jgi:hypothetical protein
MHVMIHIVLSAARETVILSIPRMSVPVTDYFIHSIVNMEMILVLSTFLLRYNVELKSPVMETIERFQHEPVAMMVKITRKSKA